MSLLETRPVISVQLALGRVCTARYGSSKEGKRELPTSMKLSWTRNQGAAWATCTSSEASRIAEYLRGLRCQNLPGVIKTLVNDSSNKN